jgi:hypothetical protein
MVNIFKCIYSWFASIWTRFHNAGKLKGMKEALSRETERSDDMPLLIAQMQHMKLVELLDTHILTHGHRKGLSVGEPSMAWLAPIFRKPITG